MGGSSTISNSETRVEALKLQSSSLGAAMIVLHGTHRIAPNLVDYGDFTAIAHTTKESSGGKGGGGGVTVVNTTYTYTASAVLALCMGPIHGTGWIWRGKEKWPAGQGPSARRLTVFPGDLDQDVWSVLETMHGGTHAQNYSGLALFCMQDYDLGSSATLENHNIEVSGPASYDDDAYVPDANPADIARDWLCHPRFGLAQPETLMGDLSAYRTYCYAAGLLLSTPLTEQAPAADRYRQLGLLTNSTTLVVDGQVHAVPLGAEPLSSTYPTSTGGTATYTYTPDNAALYSLTPDHLLDRDDGPLVTVRRKTPADAYNVVNVEYRDRASDYSVGRATAKDQAAIDVYGEKPADTVDAPWICDHETASRVAWLLLQRYQQVLNEYEFELPWTFAALVPTNIVELTDPDWELDATPVRILTMKETERGFEITAEDFPGEVPAQPVYALPGIDGFRQDYAAVPGDTVVSAIFEAPYSLTETGLEVWVAVKGAEASWGGCHIWVSADGAEYRRASTQWGASRVGQVANPLTSTATTIDVSNMTAALLSGSALDASVGATLCYIGGSSAEYVAYQTASLTGAGAYTLGGVVRGVFGATAKSHVSPDVFVRCDDAVAKLGALPLSMIGRQFYIKCQSFNVFGLNEQDIEDVTAVAYTVTGRWAVPIDEPVNLCTEGSFSQLPLGERPGTWNGGTVAAVSGQAFTKALKVTATYTDEASVRFSALEGDRFHVTGLLESASGTGTTSLGLRFYDADGGLVSFVAAASVAAGSAWVAKSGVVVAPSGSAYAVVSINRAAGATGYVQAAEIVVRRQAKTVELVENAATVVYTAEDAAPPFGMGNSIAPVVFTPDVDCIAIAEMQLVVSCDPGSRTDARMWWITTALCYQDLDSITGIGDTLVGSENLSQYQAVSRPISRTFQFPLQAGRSTVVVISFSNHNNANIDAAASQCKLKVEVIKR